MALVCDTLTGESILDLEDLFLKLTYSQEKVFLRKNFDQLFSWLLVQCPVQVVTCPPNKYVLVPSLKSSKICSIFVVFVMYFSNFGSWHKKAGMKDMVLHTQVKARSQQNAVVITSEHSCIIKLQRKTYKSELAWWSLAGELRRFELTPWASQERDTCGGSGSLIPREWHSSCLLSDGHEALILVGVRSSLQPFRVIVWKVLAIVENKGSWALEEYYPKELLCVCLGAYYFVKFALLSRFYIWLLIVVLECVRLSFNSGI